MIELVREAPEAVLSPLTVIVVKRAELLHPPLVVVRVELVIALMALMTLMGRVPLALRALLPRAAPGIAHGVADATVALPGEAAVVPADACVDVRAAASDAAAAAETAAARGRVKALAAALAGLRRTREAVGPAALMLLAAVLTTVLTTVLATLVTAHLAGSGVPGDLLSTAPRTGCAWLLLPVCVLAAGPLLT